MSWFCLNKQKTQTFRNSRFRQHYFTELGFTDTKDGTHLTQYANVHLNRYE